ncbi:centrosomal protein of 44 kDa isoform X2 [Dunckerocampus dactyliophorus]|uniref:centrosomal protein of 44 kDa isoform X2 n=1 Tax=Dunckerocampus dactyliophorus TaxID=161453 RepID=UPI0024068020|nr:centrosomal protein of 44 kDa isoform X2 [Dunckerocampus dactyliophorus]
MQSSGDVQVSLRKLETLLRVVKYPGHVDYSGLSKGEPSAFLPILSFVLTTFSSPFAEQLVIDGLELTSKTDLRFIDTLYKILRDTFHYKPILSKQQFLQRGFPQRKIAAICDVIDLVLQRHNEVKKPKVRYRGSHKDVRREAHPPFTKPYIVCDSPLVVNHMQIGESLPCHSGMEPSHDDVHSSNSPENVTNQLAEKEQKEDVAFLSSNIEQRLSALEVQIESLLCGLQRLSALEERLQERESRSNSEKKEEVITISKESWENLNSRVLLLETKLELDHAKRSVLPTCQPSAPSHYVSSMSDASQDDLKDRLHRITNMLKSTSEYL